MCQTNAAAAMKAVDSLLWYCCTCIALRVLRFATQFVTLLAAPTACVRAATCVLNATSFITSSVPLHYTTFVAKQLASSHGIPPHRTKQLHSGMHIPLRQSNATILTGFHSASLRPSFISVAFSPPAAYNLACLAACHSCGFVMVFVQPHISSTQIKNTRQTLAFLVAVYRRCTAL